jgi:hypothetical protein
MKAHHLVAAAAAFGFTCGAYAQTLKPGLWEITNDVKSSSGDMEKMQAQMQQQMASMPPDQRKKMEAAMAQHGLQIAPGKGGGMTVKTCMTKEMVERNEIPTSRGDCKTTMQQKSGNTAKMAFTCANPPATGEGEFTMQSPESYTMHMVVRTNMQGKPQTVNMNAAGKWVSADCGSVKPMSPPAK